MNSNEWGRILADTDETTPIYNDMMTAVSREESHAVWAATVHQMVTDLETYLGECS